MIYLLNEVSDLSSTVYYLAIDKISEASRFGRKKLLRRSNL
jgi:hypothetical protein